MEETQIRIVHEPVSRDDRDARFYFANLGADVARCVSAARVKNETRYAESLARAYETLSYLRKAQRPEAYEEGLLLLSGLDLARSGGTLDAYASAVEDLIACYAPMQ